MSSCYARTQFSSQQYWTNGTKQHRGEDNQPVLLKLSKSKRRCCKEALHVVTSTRCPMLARPLICTAADCFGSRCCNAGFFACVLCMGASMLNICGCRCWSCLWRDSWVKSSAEGFTSNARQTTSAWQVDFQTMAEAFSWAFRKVGIRQGDTKKVQAQSLRVSQVADCERSSGVFVFPSAASRS